MAKARRHPSKSTTTRRVGRPRRAPAWELASEPADGIVTYRLRSWREFSDFLERKVFHAENEVPPGYIWRGHRREDWSLSSSLDRMFERLGYVENLTDRDLERLADAHLATFTFAARGRRGPAPPKLLENERWALGQHFGLATPLLDWSTSPYTAAYFAFEEPDAGTPVRCVYGLNVAAIRAHNHQIINGKSIETVRPPVLDIIDPLMDDNPRLVSQGGLFTRGPIGMPVERWVAQAFEGDSKTRALIRIDIPNGDRLPFLRELYRMNVTHLSLFPDLIGASRYTNLRAELWPEPRGGE
jgi:hypothetical protein